MIVIKDVIFFGYMLFSVILCTVYVLWFPSLQPFIEFWWIPLMVLAIVKLTNQRFAEWLETPLIKEDEDENS